MNSSLSPQSPAFPPTSNRERRRTKDKERSNRSTTSKITKAVEDFFYSGLVDGIKVGSGAIRHCQIKGGREFPLRIQAFLSRARDYTRGFVGPLVRRTRSSCCLLVCGFSVLPSVCDDVVTPSLLV